MFVGKDFVLKHIRVKHAEKVEEYKQQVQHWPSIWHHSVAAQQILCCVLCSSWRLVHLCKSSAGQTVGARPYICKTTVSCLAT